jgi:predicted  nucleic acid-binding Zn-ribbon protein
MNKDIAKMVELQGFWNAVLSARRDIEKAGEKTRSLDRDADSARRRCAESDTAVRELKNTIKQHELDLKDREGRVARLEERRRELTTERELNALGKEIDVLRFDIDALEDTTIALMDDLAKLEGERTILEEERARKEALVTKERPAAEAEIARHSERARCNEERFAGAVEQLSASYRSKFVKMVHSKDGTGVARLEGEICGFCNFKVPAHLAMQAGRDETVTTCTNCGKYIYR